MTDALLIGNDFTTLAPDGQAPPPEKVGASSNRMQAHGVPAVFPVVLVQGESVLSTEVLRRMAVVYPYTGDAIHRFARHGILYRRTHAPGETRRITLFPTACRCADNLFFGAIVAQNQVYGSR